MARTFKINSLKPASICHLVWLSLVLIGLQPTLVEAKSIALFGATEDDQPRLALIGLLEGEGHTVTDYHMTSEILLDTTVQFDVAFLIEHRFGTDDPIFARLRDFVAAGGLLITEGNGATILNVVTLINAQYDGPLNVSPPPGPENQSSIEFLHPGIGLAKDVTSPYSDRSVTTGESGRTDMFRILSNFESTIDTVATRSGQYLDGVVWRDHDPEPVIIGSRLDSGSVLIMAFDWFSTFQASSDDTKQLIRNSVHYAPNKAPILASIGNQITGLGAPFNIQFSAYDVDGDALTYSATDLPSGAQIADSLFSWTPMIGQEDTIYTVEIVVGDGSGLTDAETITIEVLNILQPEADFTANPISGNAPLSVGFTYLGDISNVDRFEWDFGDGVQANITNPVHVYTTKGPHTVTLNVFNQVGVDSLQKSNLVSVAVVPVLSLLSSRIDFEEVIVGDTKTQLLVVSNAGLGEAISLPISINGEQRHQFTINKERLTVPPLGSDTLSIEFASTDTGLASSVAIIDFGSTSFFEAELIGRGVPTLPDIDVDVQTIDFGTSEIDVVVERQLVISNLGQQSLRLLNIEIDGLDFSVMTDSLSVEGEAEGILNITYQPTTADQHQAILTFVTNDEDEASFSVPLVGTGSSKPSFQVLPASIDFGSLPYTQSKVDRISLTNTAQTPRRVDFEIIGDLFSVNPDSLIFAAGQEDIVEVSFQPVTYGDRTGILRMLYEGEVLEVSLQGLGLAPEMLLDSLILDFTEVIIGQESVRTIPVRNLGNDRLVVERIVLLSERFSMEHQTLNVESNDTFELPIKYTPNSASPDSGRLLLFTNDTKASSVEIQIKGRGITPPKLALDQQVLSFQPTATGSSVSLPLSLSNTGQADLHVSNIDVDNDQLAIDPSQLVIPSGASPMVDVIFQPTQIGSLSTQLIIHSDDPERPTTIVDINGLGIAPPTRSTVDIEQIVGIQAGEITIVYEIEDINGDEVGLVGAYSIDDGASWDNALLKGQRIDLSPAEYRGELVWDSKTNLPEIAGSEVLFRLVPYDPVLGFESQIPLVIDNRPPTLLNASGIHGGDRISVFFDEPLRTGLSLSPSAFTINDSAIVDFVGIDPSSLEDGLVLNLLPGRTLPLATLQVKATGMIDELGNIQQDIVSIDFIPLNTPPQVDLEEEDSEVSALVSIAYSISDEEGNPVGLQVEYTSSLSIDWQPATIVEERQPVDQSMYVGGLTWASRADLPFYEGDVYLRVVPDDGDVGVGDTIVVRLDNHAPDILHAGGIHGGDWIGLRFDEPIDVDLLDPTFFVLEDDTSPIAVETVGSDSVTLRFSENLSLPLQSVNVSVSNLADTWGNVMQESSEIAFMPFNSLPSVALGALAGQQSGEIPVSYVIEDEEANPVQLALSYALDLSSAWMPATLTEDTLTIESESYDGQLTWQSRADLVGFEGDVYLRVVPDDGDVGVGDTTLVQLDNHAPGILHAGGVHGGDWVGLRFDEPIDRDRLDPAFFVLEDDVNPVSVEVVGSDSVTLRLGTNLSLPLESVKVSVSNLADTWGNVMQESSETVFMPFNSLPSVALGALAGQQSGEIPVSYVIEDEEANPVQLALSYALDLSSAWTLATVSEDSIAIANEAYRGQLTWQSRVDLVGFEGDVYLRLVPDDGDVGVGDTTLVRLDNRPPSLEKVSGLYGGNWVDIRFNEPIDSTSAIEVQNYIVDGYDSIASVSFGDSASVVIHFEPDLLLDVSTVTVRAVGIADTLGNVILEQTILDFVPLNTQPTVTLDSVNVEASGQVPLRYTVNDEEHNQVTLQVEFQTLDDASWQPATLFEDVSVLHFEVYNGDALWMSEVDLPGWEGDVLLRVIVSDGVESSVSTLVFHLDNNYPPLVEFTLPDIGTHDIPISYRVVDNEGDQFTLDVKYSTDGITWQSANVLYDGDEANLDAEDEFVWDSFSDLGFGFHDDVRLSLFARDNEDGSALIETLAVHNLAGDYNRDLSIDNIDVAVFLAAWNSLVDSESGVDTESDIGPATGIVPNLVPIGDTLLDFEDLIVLAQMWNWSAGSYAPSAKVAVLSEASGLLQTEQESNADESVLSISHTTDQVLAIGMELHFNPEQATLQAAQTGQAFSDPSGAIIFHHEVNPGHHVFLVGSLNGAISAGLPIVHFSFAVQESAEESVSISYDVMNMEAQIIDVGQLEAMVRRVPTEFYLGANAPNPFNPETKITYGVAEPSEVTLAIFDILGQKVAELVSTSFHNPGTYQVIWAGNDEYGRPVATGVYIYRLHAQKLSSGTGVVYTRRMLLLR